MHCKEDFIGQKSDINAYGNWTQGCQRFLGSDPGGNRRGEGESPVEYRGNLYIPSVRPSARLIEAGSDLSKDGPRLPEASSGLSDA